MPDNEELFTKITLNAFGDMRLSTNVYANIAKKIINYIRDDVPMNVII